MQDHGASAYEQVRAQAWVLPLLALSAYPVACAMFLSLPPESKSLDDQAAGMLVAAGLALIVMGPLSAGILWLIRFTPAGLRADAAALGSQPGAPTDPAMRLASALRARVATLVTLTDTPVLGGLLLALVPGADIRTAALVAIGIGAAIKLALVGAILHQTKAHLLAAGRST